MKNIFILSFGLISFVTLADVLPSPTPTPTPIVQQEQKVDPIPNKIPRWVLTTEGGTPIANRATHPKGFESRHMVSPLIASGRFHLFLGRSQEHKFRLIFDANIGTSVTRLLAFGGAGFGCGFKIKDFDIQLTLGAVLQSLMPGSPYADSMISADWAYIKTYSIFSHPVIQPFAEVELAKVVMSKLISLEGTETHVTHNVILRAEIGAQLNLPLAFFLKGQAEIFSLAKVGIASKDFATTLDPRDVYRLSATAGKYWGDLKTSVIYRATTHVDDEEALYYQAPFLYRNNILIPQYFGLEVQWKF